MNGARGLLRYGLVSTEATVNSAGSSAAVNACARAESSTTTLPVVVPSWPKSRPVATLVPSTDTSVASNDGEVDVTASMSQ